MSTDPRTPDLRLAAHRVLMAAFYGPEVPDWLRAGLADGIGSVCFFGSNLTGDDEQVRALAADLHAASPTGCLVTLDEEGGDVTRLDALRGSPTAGHAVLGAADDTDLTREVAAGLGARLRAVGVDLDLGPVADVNCEPDNPVIGVRSFGADPHLVARHVAAFVDGLQGAGVAACVKHFPGHGATVEDSHLAVPRLDIDLETLRSRELVPFAAAVRAGAAAVMTSHIVISALDAARPATTSPPVLELLRQEQGFEGLLVSDALDMVGVARPYGGIPDAAVAALAAGCDLLCLGPEHYEGELGPIVSTVVDRILAAVADGRLPEARLLEAAARVDATLSRRAPAEAGLVKTEEPGVDPNVTAARAALSLQGAPVPALTGAVVVEFDVAPQIAAGPVPWGMAGPLSAHVEGIECRGAVPPGSHGTAGDQTADQRPDQRPNQTPDRTPDPAADLLAGTDGRPLVAVVRNAHRHPWVGEQLARLAAHRPDLVTVETGWPLTGADGVPTGLPGGTRLWTYGGSAVSLRAAAERLVTGR